MLHFLWEIKILSCYFQPLGRFSEFPLFPPTIRVTVKVSESQKNAQFVPMLPAPSQLLTEGSREQSRERGSRTFCNILSSNVIWIKSSFYGSSQAALSKVTFQPRFLKSTSQRNPWKVKLIVTLSIKQIRSRGTEFLFQPVHRNRTTWGGRKGEKKGKEKEREVFSHEDTKPAQQLLSYSRAIGPGTCHQLMLKFWQRYENISF